MIREAALSDGILVCETVKVGRAQRKRFDSGSAHAVHDATRSNCRFTLRISSTLASICGGIWCVLVWASSSCRRVAQEPALHT